jgi:diguanylate cyclase (GGDEF)-like protein
MTDESSAWDVIQALRAASGGAPDDDHGLDVTAGPDSSTPEPPEVAFQLPEPDDWTDQLTGTEGRRFWERIVVNEEARHRRYGRGATVALVEFSGFEGDGSPLDRERSLHYFARIARALVKEVRTSDHIARIGPGRFGIILVETDEVSTINFVDRARKACWDELGADVELEIRAGWASATEAGSLEEAIVRAEARLGDQAFQDALSPRGH